MNKCFILITLIALIYCHKAETTKDAPATQMNKLTKFQQSKNVFLLHTNLTKTQIEQILNANITADFDNDDRDDDNEPEDDLNITTSTAVTNPNTTIPQTTVIEITEVITNINETIPLESVTVNTTTPVQEKEQKHQKKHNKQQIKEQKQEKVYQQNQTVDMMKDSNVIDIVNGTEVDNNLIQNMTIMLQKENESKISVMGFGLCLMFVACFVGLFVFSTQYNKMSKKIFFINEGMTDYLLFKENQQIQLTKKSITDI